MRMRLLMAAIIAVALSLIEYGTQAFSHVPLILVVFSGLFAGFITHIFKGAELSSVLIYAVVVSIVLAVLFATPEVEPVKVMFGLWLGANALWGTVVSAVFLREVPHTSTEQ